MVDEDSGVNTIDNNDTDPDAGPKFVNSVTQTDQRHGGDHQRRGGFDLPTQRQLLQQPIRHDAGHLHLHPLTPGSSTATVVWSPSTA